ncbi:MAG: nucleotidyltransferase family protein [Desulfobacteraceae bacterium]
MNKIAGLLLAAGASTRMGKPKQLLRAGGVSLLDRVLEQTLNSELNRVILVLGFKAQEIAQALKTDRHHPKLKIIENRDYADGISSSIIAGLSAVEKDHDHVMIILADMPHISSKLIDRLLHEYLESHSPLGGVKVKDRRSHPVVISRRFYPDLHRLRGDTGARHLFLKHPDQICLVEPEEGYEDTDIDTMEDYLGFIKSIEEP